MANKSAKDLVNLVHNAYRDSELLFEGSAGEEAARKIVHKAVKDAGLVVKVDYQEEEFDAICQELKKRGGFIKTAITAALTPIYSKSYYEEKLAKAKKEKQDLVQLSGVLEKKVEERTRQLKEAQVQLVQSAKMGALGELGAGIAHELNNPLVGIVGYTQFIMQKLKKSDFGLDDFKSCHKYIVSIDKEATRCKKIVENLLRFSRKSIEPVLKPVDIKAVIEETISLVEYQLRVSKVNLEADLSPGLFKVTGIIDQLQQVFVNLILNAQQAMPEGGQINITARNIIDEKSNKPKDVRIEVSDTGHGIPEENISKVFEPFFTTKQKDKGTGLGLSISYKIIQSHNGHISVKSQAQKGTTFTIGLPVALQD